MLKQANQLLNDGKLKESIEIYKQYIASTPGNQKTMAAYYNMAEAFSQNRQFKEASICFVNIIKIDPDFKNGEIYYELGQVYQEGKMYVESREAYQKFLSKIPNHYHCNFNLGAVHNALGQLESAVLCFERAYKNKKDYMKAYKAKIMILKKLHRFKQVIKTCAAALKLDPMDFQLNYEQGLGYFKLNMHKQAESSLKQAISNNKKHVRSYITLGELYEKTGRKQGLQLLQNCLKDNQDVIKSTELKELRYWIGVFKMNLEQYQEAAKYFQYVLKLNPHNQAAKRRLIECLQLQGHSYFQKKNYSDAIECYKEAMVHDPFKISLMNNTGLAYQNINQSSVAQQWFSKVLEREPLNTTALNSLGNLEHNRGNQKKASVIFQKIAKENPNNFDVHFNNGKRYLTRHRYAEALKELRQAEKLDKTNNFYLANDIAVVLEVLGQYDEALSYANKANKLTENRSPLFLLNRVSILMRMKKIDEAIQDMEKASQQIKNKDKSHMKKLGINVNNLKFIFNQLDHYSYLMKPITIFTQTLATEILKNSNLKQDEKILSKIEEKLSEAKTFAVQQVVDQIKRQDAVDDQISPEKARSDRTAVEQYIKEASDLLNQHKSSEILQEDTKSQRNQIELQKKKTCQLEEMLVKYIPESYNLRDKLLEYYQKDDFKSWEYGKELYWILSGYLKGFMVAKAGLGKEREINQNIYTKALKKVGGKRQFAQSIPILQDCSELISNVCGLFVDLDDQVIIKNVYETISFNYDSEDELNNDVCAVVMMFLQDPVKMNKIRKNLLFDPPSQGFFAKFKENLEEVATWFKFKKQEFMTHISGFRKAENIIRSQLAVIDVGLIISVLLTMQNRCVKPSHILRKIGTNSLVDCKMQEMICQSFTRDNESLRVSQNSFCLVMRCQLVYQNPLLNDKDYLRYVNNQKNHMRKKVVNLDLNDPKMSNILKFLKDKLYEEIMEQL